MGVRGLRGQEVFWSKKNLPGGGKKRTAVTAGITKENHRDMSFINSSLLRVFETREIIVSQASSIFAATSARRKK
jgi:hypothetical protein